MIKPLVLLLALALPSAGARAAGGPPAEGVPSAPAAPTAPAPAPATDMMVDIVSLQPPSGSTLRVDQPVLVKLRYRYAQPNEDVMIWAKLKEPGLHSTYQGASPDTTPGAGGVIERYVFLNEPGSASKLTIVAKNSRFQEIFAKEFPIRYTWVPNPKVEASRADGVGSRVAVARLTPPSPSVLKPGTRVDVELDIDNQTTHGLKPWVQPITSCNMSYDSMVVAPAGRSRLHKGFVVGEKCTITQLRIGMRNLSNVVVFSEIVDVNFRFED